MQIPKKLVLDLKIGQPVFVIEQNSVATVINRFVEPNGAIIYNTDEGIRDAENLIPIHFEKTLNKLISSFGIAPSVDLKVKEWFRI